MPAPLSPERVATLGVSIGSLELCLRTRNLTVWRVRGGRLSTIYGMLDPDADQRATVRRLWKRHAAELHGAHTVRTDSGTLVPLLGDELVGFVHVPGEPVAVPRNLLPLVHTAFACLATVLAAPARDAPCASDDLSAPAPSVTEAQARLAQVKAEEEADARRRSAAERRRILYVLEATGWNTSAAARDLEWSRGKLYQRMRRHDVERETPAPTDPRRKRSGGLPGPGDPLPQS